MSNRTTFKKFDATKQIVYGEVYAPLVPDSQGDFATADEIERVAHNFLREMRVTKIDTEHDLVKNGSCVVESFIARKGDPDFAEGAWVLGVHVPNKAIWKSIEAGELNGFSMYGTGAREPVEMELELPDDGVLKGETLPNLDHFHALTLQFDEGGDLVKGETDVVNGHRHLIKTGTITEVSDGHVHKYSMSDMLIPLVQKAEEARKIKKVKQHMDMPYGTSDEAQAAAACSIQNANAQPEPNPAGGGNYGAVAY